MAELAAGFELPDHALAEPPAPGLLEFPGVMVGDDVILRACPPGSPPPADEPEATLPGPGGWRLEVIRLGENARTAARMDAWAAARGFRWDAAGNLERIQVKPTTAAPVEPESVPTPTEASDVRRVLDDRLREAAGAALRFFSLIRPGFEEARRAVNRGVTSDEAAPGRRSDWESFDYLNQLYDLAERAAAFACLASDPALPYPRDSGRGLDPETWPTRTARFEGRHFTGGGLPDGDNRERRVGVIVTEPAVFDLA